MARYDAARMERSTRDLVSRASFIEVVEGRGTPNGGVWIDVSHLGAEVVEHNFRGMVRRCRDFGRDLARGPVEVGPTAHFLMGGVVIDPACGTAIEGLFAAGEDTGGVHGANRLGGNGVAESTVFGGLAGDAIAAFVEGRPPARLDVDALRPRLAALTAPFARPAGAALYALQHELRDVMWEEAGLVRDGDSLQRALAAIDRIEADLDTVGVAGDPALNTAWQDWLSLRSQTVAARLIVRSALERRESRGAHYRRDCPSAAASAPFTVRVRCGDDGPVVTRAPVAFTRATPADATTRQTVEIGD
jgi:succinate dehydrogenase/fumarate reductase flavoprotein subunit